MYKKIAFSLPMTMAIITFAFVFIADCVHLQNFNRIDGFFGTRFLDPLIYSLPGWRGVLLVAVVWGTYSFFAVAALVLLACMILGQRVHKNKVPGAKNESDEQNKGVSDGVGSKRSDE